MQNREPITVAVSVNAPIKKTWDCFTKPEHITQWCFASPDWQAPYAENDLRPGGRFKTRMEAKDGSFGFDMEGIYGDVAEYGHYAYQLPDGRNVSVTFSAGDDRTKIVETFDPETQNPPEMQRAGWQAILENFKKYTEGI